MRMLWPTFLATNVPSAQPGPAIVASAPAARRLPVWRAVVPVLERDVRIPILLPSRLPGVKAAENVFGPPSMYSHVLVASPKTYIVTLGAPGCHGAHACTGADVSGGLATMPIGKPIALARGITGVFVAATCGANCGDATIAWRSHGIIYAIGENVGRLSSLLPSANSAIVNGPLR